MGSGGEGLWRQDRLKFHETSLFMNPWKAARVGDPLSAVDTPALVLDLVAASLGLGDTLMLVPGHCDPIFFTGTRKCRTPSTF